MSLRRLRDLLDQIDLPELPEVDAVRGVCSKARYVADLCDRFGVEAPPEWDVDVPDGAFILPE